MMSDRDSLRHFMFEVMYNVMMFDLATVTNDKGDSPIVACLDEEPLSEVLRRVEAAGGYATVFSRTESDDQGRYLVRKVEFIDQACALERGADRMIEGDEPNPDIEFGMFLDYLETQEHGVLLPKQLGIQAEAVSQSSPVQLQPV